MIRQLLVVATLTGCASHETGSQKPAPASAVCRIASGGAVVTGPACGSSDVVAMRDALDAYCRAGSYAAYLCSDMVPELTACKLHFTSPRACGDAIAAADAHGGYWHGAIFSHASGGYVVKALDGGDIK